MPKKIELIGKRFGRLMVIDEYDRPYSGAYRYLCKCDCGNEVVVWGCSLRAGHSRSCGCYKRDTTIARNTKYKKEDKILYSTWKGMRQRCNDKNHIRYNRYGGRGIQVCNEWNDYMKFYYWSIENGYEKGKQLDRINNDADYTPNNCRWVTAFENNNNKNNVKRFEIEGVVHTLSEWCQIYNIKKSTVRARLRRGWDIEKALTTPLLNK